MFLTTLGRQCLLGWSLTCHLITRPFSKRRSIIVQYQIGHACSWSLRNVMYIRLHSIKMMMIDRSRCCLMLIWNPCSIVKLVGVASFFQHVCGWWPNWCIALDQDIHVFSWLLALAYPWFSSADDIQIHQAKVGHPRIILPQRIPGTTYQ